MHHIRLFKRSTRPANFTGQWKEWSPQHSDHIKISLKLPVYRLIYHVMAGFAFFDENFFSKGKTIKEVFL
ncbi:hypothetical protein BTA30_04015 [Bacillus swezeyi]|uniref:Uncharacterized protein n=1 Tax=Bacillus swezeyi TaxID=1925020 RepID=A0A1R1QWV7_9BACI|nr:hypothetical protein BW143_03635 [Bacillus swezeyi]OMI32083.1 hypothetical protein BTA30_04015 [Bacillus swezeyi]